jgi:hypothetical protein
LLKSTTTFPSKSPCPPCPQKKKIWEQRTNKENWIQKTIAIMVIVKYGWTQRT